MASSSALDSDALSSTLCTTLQDAKISPFLISCLVVNLFILVIGKGSQTQNYKCVFIQLKIVLSSDLYLTSVFPTSSYVIGL